MSRAVHRALAMLFVVATVAVGCYPPTPSHPEYIDRSCGAQCDRAAACDPSYDRASCFNRCKLF
jgi:hypothetical protein